MRFCDYGKEQALQIIVPKALQESLSKISAGPLTPGTKFFRDKVGIICIHTPEGGRGPIKGMDDLYSWAKSALKAYETYLYYRYKKWRPEDARFCLPIGTKTEIVATFNLRQWRHVFRERALNKNAQWEIKGLTQILLKQFRELLPCVFGDLELPVEDTLEVGEGSKS